MTKHFVSKSDTETSEKDLWQTPVELFIALNNEFYFDVDICASAENALCDLYFDKEHSALGLEWDNPPNKRGSHEIKSAFINPPYSETSLFLSRANEQARIHNITVVALVNANTDTKWFSDAEITANEIRLITGRVGFVKPNGEKANGNTKGQCLIIWRGRSKTPCNITRVNRDSI